jgi:alkyl sulfatase BDS1-like metallo-beta-lactamase superfamily hydrolase
MTNGLREIGDACWDSFDFGKWQRAIGTSQATEVADDVVYIATRGVVGNVTAVRTPKGLVLFDTASATTARQVFDTLRKWTSAPIHTVIFTHGHVDHVMGADLLEEEASRRGQPPIRFVAHRNMQQRFARYAMTAGFNATINGRQFGIDDFKWPTRYRAPDLTYDERLELTVGGVTFELNHGLGETDDHTWTWIAHRKLIVSGDFVIWAAPNCGNPQKVQRYMKGWANAYRSMQAKEADALVPGHGPAVFGRERVTRLLDDGARFLENVHDQVVALMNAGKTLDEVVASVRVPEDLLARPYLQPTYDDPEFLVRNVWRLYGGWWDGDPAHLKPAPTRALATELASLVGGASKLAERAKELAAAGDLRLACHLAELAVNAEPSSREAHLARMAVNTQRAAQERTLMARGVFTRAARESQMIVDPGAVVRSPNRTGL